MGHSQAEKAQSRERILSEAASQIRRQGLESISIGKLMRKVGLTHGGFYNHFASRSELLEEALRRALEDGGRGARSGTNDNEAPADLSRFVRRYLSRAHRDSPGTGCAMAALLADVGRADPELRKAMEPHLKRFIARMAASEQRDGRDPVVAVAAMIGALGIARVLTDRRESDQVLKEVREFVLETLGGGAPQGDAPVG